MMTISTTIIKPFHNQNGYTAINNYILDYIMPTLSPNGWKVLCFIIRKTEGWNKEQDQLSFSQIMEGTGIGSRTTVNNAISELVEKYKYVNIIRGDRVNSNTYALNIDYEIDLGSTETVLPLEDEVANLQEGSTETVPEPSTETVLPLVQKLYSQKKPLNKPLNKIPNGIGDKPPDAIDLGIRTDKTTPKWQLMNEFLDISKIPIPDHKPDKDFFWQKINAIYSIARQDIDTGKMLIRQAYQKLISDGLTVSDPGSLVKTCRAIMANGAMNGQNSRNNQARSPTTKRTGADLQRDPTFNPFTGETVVPP